MDASAFVNKHCNFAEASMIASELGQSQMNQGAESANVSQHHLQAQSQNAQRDGMPDHGKNMGDASHLRQ